MAASVAYQQIYPSLIVILPEPMNNLNLDHVLDISIEMPPAVVVSALCSQIISWPTPT
jgi:hypothetical protein